MDEHEEHPNNVGDVDETLSDTTDTVDDPVDAPADGSTEQDGPADGGSDPVPADELSRRLVALNRRIVGDLRVSFPERDIAVRMDADAALRLIACWRGDRRFEDRLDPATTPGVSGWVGIDVGRAIGISWAPLLDSFETDATDRVLVDPTP